MGMRAFRTPDELWAAALAQARAEGRTLTDVLNDCLQAYTERRLAIRKRPKREPARKRSA